MFCDYTTENNMKNSRSTCSDQPCGDSISHAQTSHVEILSVLHMLVHGSSGYVEILSVLHMLVHGCSGHVEVSVCTCWCMAVQGMRM